MDLGELCKVIFLEEIANSQDDENQPRFEALKVRIKGSKAKCMDLPGS